MTAGRGAEDLSPEQRVRLDGFKRAHPGVTVTPAAFSGWDATIPLDGGEQFLHRGGIDALLDDTEVITGDAHPD